jgi:hypothetical protein
MTTSRTSGMTASALVAVASTGKAESCNRWTSASPP